MVKMSLSKSARSYLKYTEDKHNVCRIVKLPDIFRIPPPYPHRFSIEHWEISKNDVECPRCGKNASYDGNFWDEIGAYFDDVSWRKCYGAIKHRCKVCNIIIVICGKCGLYDKCYKCQPMSLYSLVAEEGDCCPDFSRVYPMIPKKIKIIHESDPDIFKRYTEATLLLNDIKYSISDKDVILPDHPPWYYGRYILTPTFVCSNSECDNTLN